MIRFMRYNLVYFIISALVLVPGMFYLLRFGLKPSIDFTGGSLLEVKIPKPDVKSEDITETLEKAQVEIGSTQMSGTQGFLLKLKPIDQQKKNELIDVLKKKYIQVEELRFETVGPILGAELLRKTLVAAVVAILIILSYVAYAFRNIRFGVAAVLALLHDVLVVIGVFAILGKIAGVEIDVLFVTAVLTTMSFSVHDTIVVFDRIREMLKKGDRVSYEELIDRALTETMGRSLNNSLTIVFMLLALFLLGGESIKWFVLALLAGTISGAYSSPFVATPILFVWHNLRDRK